MKTALKVLVILMPPILLSLITYLWIDTHFVQPYDSNDNKIRLVEIPPGLNFREIAKKLHEQKLVRDTWALGILVKIRKINTTKINAGEYELAPSMTPTTLIEKLIKGEVFRRVVTLKPGQSIWDLGAEVEGSGLLKKTEMDQALRDPHLLKEAGLNADSFEGYLHPETYNFSRPVTAKQIIWTMLVQAQKAWPQTYNVRSELMSMTRHDVLTLASIIEKESGRVDEQSQISSVFHNRLRLNMKLQSDPTVTYGLSNFSGTISERDLQTDHPYNTYTRYGLPKGPICIPSVGAIKAALYPSETEYLYFVADGQGGHVFSTTLKEHNEAVQKYRQGLLGKELGRTAGTQTTVPAPAEAITADHEPTQEELDLLLGSQQ